jgi:hypothetical protein
MSDNILFKPMDVIVFYSRPYNILHKLINWRCLDDSPHCATVVDLASSGEAEIYDLDIKGFHINLLSAYKDWFCTVHRYNKVYNEINLRAWCDEKLITSNGYDLWAQWIMGFCLGLTKRSLANDEHRWTCAELPYWAFQENGYKLTAKDEVLPMPRFFRYSTEFDCLYEGPVSLLV